MLIFLLSSFMFGPSALAAGEQEFDEVTPSDPWITINRKIFYFNDKVDRYLLRPVSSAYLNYTPSLFQRGVQNFIFNLGEVITVTNDLLQGKFAQAGNDSARFIINTTLGLGGLIDVGYQLGLERHREDFGQTLGYWGMSSGPYIMLPFLGPSSLRDGVGLIPDYAVDPSYYVSDDSVGYLLFGIKAIDLRASLIEQEPLIKGDKYVFIRETYLQRRAFLVNDGVVDEDPFLDEDEWD